jgi:REP element-mobilizing transposase RayT
MARPLRIEFPGALYHITARGNARQDIFLVKNDRLLFFDRLAREIDQQRWLCHAYCLMNNHYHLVIETPEANLVRGMTRLNGTYTQAFNRRHGRVGHVLQGRYESIVVDKDSYLLELARYVVLNPVRAGLVKEPAAWMWSSYRATVGEVVPPNWLTTDWLLEQFAALKSVARRAYQDFVMKGAGTKLWDRLIGQIWLGDQPFLERMQKLVSGTGPSGYPGNHRRPARPTPQTVIAAVASAYRINQAQVLDRSRPDAFRAAVYLLRRAANLTLNEAAALARISAPRISQIQADIESEKPELPLRQLITRYKLKT